jgi:hypothetical protein
MQLRSFRVLSARLAIVSLAFGACAPARSSSDDSIPTIRLNPGSGEITRASFEVVGLDAKTISTVRSAQLDRDAWIALFPVTVDPGSNALDGGERPAILGKYQVLDNVLRFQPQFPLVRGVRYRALFDLAKLPSGPAPSSGPITALFALPARDANPSTLLTRVDPVADTLPENQLKLYLNFTAPMRRGGVYEHIHLRDQSGKSIELPFLEIGEELWDSSGKRLTLLFDPGRVKRGLKPREEAGPILEQGKRYELTIDRDWLDAAGSPLVRPYRKSFRAGPPDETPPDPKSWIIEAPGANSAAALVVKFPEPLDRALLEHVLRVADSARVPIVGDVQVDDDAKQWRFSPRRAWEAGAYQLLIDTRVEDLAGNRIGRPFEVDTFEPIRAKTAAPEIVELPFKISAR